MDKSFDVDAANKMAAVTEALDSMQGYLSQLRMKSVEENRAMLMFEESLVTLMEHADPERPQRITVKASRLLGTLTISLTMPGHEFPFSEKVAPFGLHLEEEEDGDQAQVIRGLVLQSFGSRLKYKHRDGKNTVRIEAQRSPYSFLYQTMSCLLAAVVLGVLCRVAIPQETYMALNDMVLDPGRTMFINALKIVVSPVVFFSLAISIAQFGNLSEVGRLGGKLMLVYFLMEVVACVMSAGTCVLTRLTGIPFSHSMPLGSGGPAPEAATLSLRDFLVGIVPSNFLQPFLDSNMLQLMFLGVLCGIAVGEIGDYSKPLRDFIEACYELFMRMTGILTRFIPIAVLCSIWSLMLTTGTDLLFSLLGVLVVVFLGMVALVCIDCVRLRIAGLSPRHFLQMYAPAMAHVFSTTSSSASLPENMKAARNMGVPEKVYSLSLPLGVIFSKNGSIFYRATTALLIAQLFGIEVSAAGVVSLLVSASLITLATPGVPGGAFIAFSALLFQLGVPSEALACIIGIDAVMDLFIGVVNCFGTMVSTVTLSYREQLLDVAGSSEQGGLLCRCAYRR